MPKIDEGFIPEGIRGKKHLALLMPNSEAIGIPPGSVLLYVENPLIANGSIPMLLTEVDRKQWKFRCACGKQGCTLSYVAKISHKGKHPLPDAVGHE